MSVSMLFYISIALVSIYLLAKAYEIYLNYRDKQKMFDGIESLLSSIEKDKQNKQDKQADGGEWK